MWLVDKKCPKTRRKTDAPLVFIQQVGTRKEFSTELFSDREAFKRNGARSCGER